jgi:ABC-type branched-subunit amino acid transport system substrate-binding protein
VKRLKGSIAALVAAMVAVAGLGLATTGGAGAAPSVRGFDGSTITLASLGVVAQFTNTPIGVQARIKKFNDTNEIKGVKLKWTDFADDKQNDTDALSEERRLVTQEGVFAIVGDVSANNGPYLKQQHVPYYGWAFDNTYCSDSTKPDTTIYGFGFNGCLVPSTPKVMPDNGVASYKYVSQKTGKKKPTLTIFGTDLQAGKDSVKYQSISYAGAGYDVVAKSNTLPPPPVSDYTPYVQEYMTSDNGKAPDAILCLLATQCINVYTGLQAAGYQGTFISSLYSDFLTKTMNGSAANVPFVAFDQTTPGLTDLRKTVDAYQAGASAKLDTAMMAGYLSTDMFIQALKTVAKKGKSAITPEAVQKASMNQTWQIKGVAGPTTYPNATITSYQSCSAEVLSDGTKWSTVTPYACSTKQYPVK